MTSLFSQPKVPGPVPVVNPADTQNRINMALANQLASGGTNADLLTNPFTAGAQMSQTGPGKAPSLTGIG